MPSSLRLAALLVFVVFPLVEIALLIKAGETIGFWATVGLLALAAALGTLVIREQGVSMVARMLGAVNEGQLPFAPMLDSYALIVAGALLIVPGFLSDVVGLLLLVPPIRSWCIRSALAGFADRAGLGDPAAARKSSRTTVIETTYERIDEEDEHKPGGPGNAS